MKFIEQFNKELSRMSGISRSSEPPRYWYHTGNYVLNKIISGSFYKGIPQGRITLFAGPSSSGKSFLVGNVVREAQKAGAYVLVVDSENALDNEFMKAIGVDTEEKYTYVSVITISQAQKVISAFLKAYKNEYGESANAPQILICIDSLSMLLTDSELENYEKGVQKGDQGQRNKQLKALLRSITQDIKTLNVAVVATAQVYKNQDMLNGEGTWIISDAIRYSPSQIILLTKLKLRDGMNIEGIKMKCEGYKTRFTKPYQSVTIEVPYDKGMNPYSGLLEVAKELGVVNQSGAWYTFKNQKFQAKNIEKYADEIIKACEEKQDVYLEAMLQDGEKEDLTEGLSSQARRVAKVAGGIDDE